MTLVADKVVDALSDVEEGGEVVEEAVVANTVVEPSVTGTEHL